MGGNLDCKIILEESSFLFQFFFFFFRFEEHYEEMTHTTKRQIERNGSGVSVLAFIILPTFLEQLFRIEGFYEERPKR